MQKLGFLLLSFIVVVAVQAQKKIFPSHLGSFSLENYDTNILRVSFQPKNYKKNENISDAVIAKPLMKIISSDITNIGGAMVIPHGPGELFIDYHEMNNHRGFTFSLKADEKIFGGGVRALPLNRRGYRLNLYNNPGMVMQKVPII
jgi:oligosaccharide 4-alpha-D-glucosyltransferase